MYVPWHVIKLGLAALVVLALLYWLWRDVREAVERDELTARPDKNNPRLRDTSSRRHSA